MAALAILVPTLMCIWLNKLVTKSSNAITKTISGTTGSTTSMTTMVKANASTLLTNCDYLVIGAGAASIAFIDTLLTQRPSTKVVLVDKNPVPGGHWVHAYGFVQLHQPSLLYGVSSRQLEGNWLKLVLGRFTLPWKHRASKEEILHYYDSYIQDKVAAGQIQYFPNCQYHFRSEQDTTTTTGLHSFSSLDGRDQYSVKVQTKLVNGILGNCIVPSQSPVTFPVDHGVQMLTPNQIFDGHRRDNNKKHFVVLGCGKTAMDTVVYLQRTMKVKPKQISWVVPSDVWMLLREGAGGPWSWPQALLEHNHDERQASLALEQKGVFVRLDPNVEPTVFRFPVVGKDEVAYMRRVRNLIRRGRLSRITKDEQDGTIQVEFENDQKVWIPEVEDPNNDLIFVHCTSPGPFNGNENSDIFASEQQLNLNEIFAPPVPISMSVLAYLESARLNNTLDFAFGRKLLRSLHQTDDDDDSLVEQAPTEISENEVLRRLILTMNLKSSYDARRLPFQSILNLAMFLSIANNKDPMVGYQFLKTNRLSFFSIPGFKGGIYETLGLLVERSKLLGYTPNETRMFQLLRDRLQVLEGK